jgi:pyruvate formate lyase activating enzyme
MHTESIIRVHSYESMGTYDGPGLRLVVFLQGCNFKCLYCANPDTLPLDGGEATTPQKIVQMALNQKPFFGKRGGITFSGGEPTLQAAALIPLFRELKQKGIHICLDTNGSIRTQEAEELFRLSDLILLDVKEFNETRHRTLTGRSNSPTLATASWLEAQGKPMWLRYVLVPGYSDFTEDMEALCQHFKDFRMVERLEILPYHTFGVHKYAALGQPYPLEGVKENTSEQIEAARELFARHFPVVRVNR